MAAKTNAAPAVEEERFEITLPRPAANEDPNAFVSVNGVNYVVPKGKTVRVPRAIYKELRRAQRAEEEQYDRKNDMIEDAARSAAMH